MAWVTLKIGITCLILLRPINGRTWDKEVKSKLTRKSLLPLTDWFTREISLLTPAILGTCTLL